MLSYIFAAIVLFAQSKADDNFTPIYEAFTSNMIVPQVTKAVPELVLSVRFSTEVVNLGNVIPAYAAAFPPYIHYDAVPDALYTVIIVNADSPSVGAPIDSLYLQALVVNIQGNNLRKCDYLTPYTPVTPYPGSGYKRYVILLFKQDKRIDVTTPYLRNIDLNLLNFSVEDFAASYDLGDPIAGNFFLSQLVECDDEDDNYQQCLYY